MKIENQLKGQSNPGKYVLDRINIVMDDNSLSPRHKQRLFTEIERVYNPTLIAGMIKPLVTKKYEKAYSKEELLAKLFPHLQVREARSKKGYMLNIAIKKLRDKGVPIETAWRPGTGYKVCIPTKRDRISYS